MNSQSMRRRITEFTDTSVKVFSRISQMKITIERLISKHGETAELSDLIKQYYQTMIDEYDLLLIIFYSLIEDPFIKKLDTPDLEKGITNIKELLESTLVEAKMNLEEYTKGKPKVQIIKQQSRKNKNLTRELLNAIGLK